MGMHSLVSVLRSGPGCVPECRELAPRDKRLFPARQMLALVARADLRDKGMKTELPGETRPTSLESLFLFKNPGCR